MSHQTSPEGNKITGLHCQVFGHNFVVTNHITAHIKEYKCTKCQKEVTTTPNAKLEILTPELRAINADLKEVYQKRRKRRRRAKVA